MKGTRTPHPGVTKRDRGPPSSQTTPYPKWASGARLHLPTYCIPPQCTKPAAVAILCSCFGDKAILNLSANTWRPTRFKWRPPSLIANKLLIGRPYIDPSLWIKEVKVGIKPQCFFSGKASQEVVKGQVQLLGVLPVTAAWQHSRENGKTSGVETPYGPVQGLYLLLHAS